MNCKETLSRKEFLRRAGIIFGSGFIGLGVGAEAGRFIGNLDKFGKLSSADKKLLFEIEYYRKSLGLLGLPLKMEQGLTKRRENLSNPGGFLNALPEYNKSYGIRIHEVMKGLFGDFGTSLVREVRIDLENPFGISFSGTDRSLRVSESIHNIPIEDLYSDYVLHEAVGHGSDPEMEGIAYPSEMIVKVEHGRWRALAQALLVEGHFFKHPEDKTYPFIKKTLGEVIGRYAINNIPFNNLVSGSDAYLFFDTIRKVAKSREKNLGELKYNKKICLEIGEKTIDFINRGRIVLKGDLENAFSCNMEISLREIYAEMLKYALFYPSAISYNGEIIAGATEILSAIRGEVVYLPELAFNIRFPSEYVLERNRAEKTFLEQDCKKNSLFNDPVFEDEAQKIASGSLRKFKEGESKFLDFVTTGKVPLGISSNPGENKLLYEYGFLCSMVVEKYPMLKNVGLGWDDCSFDPELNIWEIREIEGAMDSGFIRKFLKDGIKSDGDYNLAEIKRRVTVLKNFTSSSAF